MGLRDDLGRFREVGEEHREDLKGFISYSGLDALGSKDIEIPIRAVDLLEFKYDRLDTGNVGQGKDGMLDVGQSSDQPEPGDGKDEGDDSGEEGVGHEYYKMDSEQFAEASGEELDLELEPKGKEVVEEVEGDFTDITRSGPHSIFDFKRLFKGGLKHKLAMGFDEESVRETMKVEGITAREVLEWCRESNILVSMVWTEDEWGRILGDKRRVWASFAEVEESVERTTAIQCTRWEGLREIPFCRENERYCRPKVIEKEQSNVVVVNIHDVSGSMREMKRELVEHAFTPLDWYLTGECDHAELIYIAHDTEAWEVERDEFSGIRSGDRTRISSAYKLAKGVLDKCYPWHGQNRYVFTAGDSENSSNNTKKRVVPFIQEIDASLHTYVEVQFSGTAIDATHVEEVERSLEEQGNVVVAYVSEPNDVIDAICVVLSTEATAE